MLKKFLYITAFLIYSFLPLTMEDWLSPVHTEIADESDSDSDEYYSKRTEQQWVSPRINHKPKARCLPPPVIRQFEILVISKDDKTNYPNEIILRNDV